jgi:hypothetical protein
MAGLLGSGSSETSQSIRRGADRKILPQQTGGKCSL